MNKTLLAAKERLAAFGYDLMDGDEALLSLAASRYEQFVKDDCGFSDTNNIPDALLAVAADMAVGEFIKAKMAFSPNDIAAVASSPAVKQITIGDTATAFSVDEKASPTACLCALADYLINHGKEEMACYRKIRW